MNAVTNVATPQPSTSPYAWSWPHALLWACLYAAALVWGQSMAWVGGAISPVWPAAGVGLAAGWWLGLRVIPVLAVVDLAITLSSSLPLEPWVAVPLALNSAVLLPVAGRGLRAWLKPLNWGGGADDPHVAVGHILRLMGVAVLLGLLDALAGTALMGGFSGSPEGVGAVVAWWLGDVLGVVLFAPALIWMVPGYRSIRCDAEVVWLGLATLVVCGLLFGPVLSLPGFKVVWMTLLWPISLWASLRLGTKVLSPLMALVALLAITGSGLGWGVLGDMAPLNRLVVLQTVLGWVSVSGLLVAAFVEAHKHVSDQRDTAQKLAEAWVTHSVDGHLLVTQDLLVESINPQACRLLGVNAAPGVGLMGLLPKSASAHGQALADLQVGEVCSFDMDVVGAGHPTRLVVEFKATRISLLGTVRLLVTLRDVSVQIMALESLERERGMFVSGPVVAIEWGTGPSLPIVYASPNVETLLGHHPHALISEGLRMEDLTHPTDRARVQAEVARFESSAAPMYEQRYRLQHKAGHWVPVLDVTHVAYNPAGEVVRKRGYLLDQSSEMAQRALADRLTQALDQSPEAVVITSLAGDVEFANAAFTRQTGYPLAEVQGKNMRLLSSGQTPRQRFADMWQTLAHGQPWEGEVVNRRRSGETFVQWLRVSVVLDAEGQPQNYLGLMQDLTERRQIEQRIYRLSQFDILTGLSNRQRLIDKLQALLDPAHAWQADSGLVVFNINRFKRINEAEGHEVGDALLRQLASQLEALCGKDDMAARLGADEFCWLVLPTGTEGVQRRLLAGVRKLREQSAQGVALADRTLSIELTAGATLWPVGADDSPALIVSRAETALNTARRLGDGELRFFDQAMGDAVRQRFALENDLRRGIPDQQLRLYLQPQVNASGDVVSWEALARWQHPERGLLLPGLFVPIAEESDLILDLERWMFRQVFNWVASHEARGQPVSCSINLSARHFRHPGFAEEMKQLFDETGAQPARITLEITESIALDCLEEAAARMWVLRGMGCHFSLDDFGTGYSSLSYIKRLPISELKIDKVFINDVPKDRDAVALVTAIVQVAQTLHLRVVAEGVETEDQAAFLRGLSQDMWLQGYLYGRPQDIGLYPPNV